MSHVQFRPAPALSADDLSDPAFQMMLLRKLRESHGTVPVEVQHFILQRRDLAPVDASERLATLARRMVIGAGLLVAMLCAPLAMVVAMMKLGIDARTDALTGSLNGLPDLFARIEGSGLMMPETFGYGAALTMLLTFSMTNRVLLRLSAIMANVFFIAYAIGAGLQPVLMLHATLLPVNTWHLFQAISGQMRDTSRLRARRRAQFAR
jgi:hypothetical protein